MQPAESSTRSKIQRSLCKNSSKRSRASAGSGPRRASDSKWTKTNVKPLRNRLFSTAKTHDCLASQPIGSCPERRACQLPVIGSGFASFRDARFTHYQKFGTGQTSDNKYYQSRGIRVKSTEGHCYTAPRRSGAQQNLNILRQLVAERSTFASS